MKVSPAAMIFLSVGANSVRPFTQFLRGGICPYSPFSQRGPVYSII